MCWRGHPEQSLAYCETVGTDRRGDGLQPRGPSAGELQRGRLSAVGDGLAEEGTRLLSAPLPQTE